MPGRLPDPSPIPVLSVERKTRHLDGIRFLSVAGLYHSGTNAMWRSLSKSRVTGLNGFQMSTYGSKQGGGGYPPCSFPLLPNGKVDASSQTIDGSSTTAQTSPDDAPGVMWRDWHFQKEGLHRRSYTKWKHTPPQHPSMQCFRNDTLYVIMIRHPHAWIDSIMNGNSHDIYFVAGGGVLIERKSMVPRGPVLSVFFESLDHMWVYYMKGYMAWAQHQPNVLLVSYERFLKDRRQTVSQIFDMARGGGGAGEEEDHSKYIISVADEGKGSGKWKQTKKQLDSFEKADAKTCNNKRKGDTLGISSVRRGLGYDIQSIQTCEACSGYLYHDNLLLHEGACCQS